MSDNKTSQESPKPIELNWPAAEKHLKDVEDYLVSFAGKDGMNPYFRLNSEIEPLKRQLAMNARSSELHKLIMSLKKEEPKVNV